MGFRTEFNWALKLAPENGLPDGEISSGMIIDFSKDGNRVYPVGIPIDLLDPAWEALAKVIVIECQIASGKTSGRCKVIRIYSGEEKEILTRNWRETAEFI